MRPNRGGKSVPPGRGGYDSAIVEVTGEPVARPRGQNAQGQRRPNQMTRDFVNGAIATHGVDDLDAARRRLRDQIVELLLGPARHNVVLPVTAVLPDHGVEIIPAARAGESVDHEEDAQGKECIR